MFEKFHDNLDESFTRPKTIYSKSNKNNWQNLLSPPNAAYEPRADRIAAFSRLCQDQLDDKPLTLSQRFKSPPASQQLTQIKFLIYQSSDHNPIILSAQQPRFTPGPIEFSNPEVLTESVANGDASVTINRPINKANLVPLHHFGQQFY